MDWNTDRIFFHKSVEFLSHHNPVQALQSFFSFLARSFPLDGMVFHQFSGQSQQLLQLFAVNADRLYFIGRSVPFSREQMMFVRAFYVSSGTNYIENSEHSITGTLINQNLNDLIPSRPRGQLVICLGADRHPLGLVRLLGSHPLCFTDDHIRKMSLLSGALAFTFAQLLQREDAKNFLASRGHGEFLPDLSVKDSSISELIGSQGGLKAVMEKVAKLAGSDAPVLILGETGTGKELIADAIQRVSVRRNAPFIKVNCGAIPETLIDSELFGHEKGAFTNANSMRPGRFELAHKGTLFLDEIGELSPQAQVRLLRTLQNHVVERLGSTSSIAVDVRIIAATHRNLEIMLMDGSFRKDLYYRLNVFPIQVPPLRERTQDIPDLVHYFVKQISKRLDLPPVSGLLPRSAEKLMQYAWPGNVRELQNIVERALILNYEDPLQLDVYLSNEELTLHETSLPMLKPETMPFLVCEKAAFQIPDKIPFLVAEALHSELVPPIPLEQVLRAHILKALAFTKGKIHGPGGAGELLEINPDTLRKRMQKLGIQTRFQSNRQR